MPQLVLLRHGESEWNLTNRFSGWTDVDLTENGRKEARESAKLLIAEGFTFDIAYTPCLSPPEQRLFHSSRKLNLV